MSESPAAPQMWCVQVHVDPAAGGTRRPAAVPAGPQDDRFPLEPHWRRASARAAEIDQALTDIAIATRRQLAPSPRLIGSRGRPALSGSYLVSAEKAADFPGIVQQLTGGHVSLRVTVTGPWPPSSFTGQRPLEAQSRWRLDHAAISAGRPAAAPGAVGAA
jgi:Gas vesicle synthesis protein GvpL/GvpF